MCADKFNTMKEAKGLYTEEAACNYQQDEKASIDPKQEESASLHKGHISG